MTVAAPGRVFVDTPDDAKLRRYVIAAAEARLRRRLSQSELNMDHLAIDRALEAGKRRLHAAIEQEKRSVIRARATNPHRFHLEPTVAMRDALVALHREGRRQAVAELEALGVTPRRQYADPFDVPPSLDTVMAALMGRLAPIGVRVRTEHDGIAAQVVAGDVGEMSRAAMAREVDRLVPGALDAASRLVSGAFDAGRGDIFSLNSDLIGSWIYTAVMDGATCPECEALDATEYPSWDAIQTVLPDGGPNPACDGDGRCRCMAVPGEASAAGSSPLGPDDLTGGEPVDQLVSDLTAIRSQAEWITSDDAAFKAAELTPSGYDAFYYPHEGIAGYLREQQDVVLAAGRRMREEIDASPEVVAAKGEVATARDAMTQAEARYEETRAAGIDRLSAAWDRQQAELDAAENKYALETYGKPYDRLSLAQQVDTNQAAAKLPDYREALARYEAETKAVDADRRAAGDAKDWGRYNLGKAEEAEAKARRDAIMETLGRVREVGPSGDVRLSFAASSDARADVVLRAAQEYLPRDWIEKARMIESSWDPEGRGLHSSRFGNAIIKLSGSRGMIESDTTGLSVAIHELGHEFEERVEYMLDLERAFYEWRARGRSWDAPMEELVKLRDLHPDGIYKSTEVTRPDEFDNPYSGRWYDQRNYELVSMGLDSLLGARGVIDPEYEEFILGLLALV